MDTGKLILIGVGGFILYEMFIAPASTTAATTSSTTTPPASATGPVVSAQQAQLQAFITALGAQGPTTLLVAGRQTAASATLDVSQWNYYLNQISGQQLGPDLTGYVPNANAGITASQYWAALAAYASGQAPTYSASGVSGVDGLGIVHSSHTPAPWHGTPGDGPGRFDSKDGEIWGW